MPKIGMDIGLGDIGAGLGFITISTAGDIHTALVVVRPFGLPAQAQGAGVVEGQIIVFAGVVLCLAVAV